MRKLKRRLMALFTVLVMLLNVGGISADSTAHGTTDSIIEAEQAGGNAVEGTEESGEVITDNSIEEEEKDNVVEEKEEEKEEGQEKEEDTVEENQEDENKEEVEEPEKDEEVEGEEVVEGEEDQELEEELAEEGPVILNTEVNGVRITVSAGVGVLPQDARLSANPISEDDSQNYTRKIMESTGISLGNFIAFDINILDNDGWVIQPNGLVDVKFSGLEAIQDAEEIMVYHLESNEGNKQESNLYSSRNTFFNTADDIRVNEINAQSYGNEVSFSTDHFSIYGVGTMATVTYKFYEDADANSAPVDIQIVLNGEKLVEPEIPAKQDGKKFTGWYLVGEANPINFDNLVTVGVGTSAVHRVEARYDDVFYVYFVYNDNVIATKEVGPGGTTNDSGIPIVITEAGKALIRWSTTENGGAFNFSAGITADTTLHAVLGDRWKVTFDAQGGNSVLPKYIEHNQPLGAVDTPVRAGYTFQKWSANANGTGPNYTNGTLINSNIKLYAIWVPKTVNYSIVYWLENADDNLYTYQETVIAQGTSGTNATVANNLIASARYTYFTYKNHDNQGPIIRTINGDGTTVVNVYYSRNSYKVEFNLDRSNSKLTIGGQTYNHPTKYSFTAKYESDISNLWPIADDIPDVTVIGSGRNPTTTVYQFYGWTSSLSTTTFVSKRLKLTSDLISTSGTRAFTGSWRDDLSKHTLHYMIESLTGSGEKQFGTGSNKKWYIEDISYSQTANSTGNWSAKQLPGVTNVGKESETGKQEYFYYDRLSYDLDFYSPTTVRDQRHTLKYGSSIQNRNYTPAKPAGISADYVFMGWYTNAQGQGTPFNFTNAKMPENNLVLYAKWAPPKYQVKYYETEDEDITKLKTIDNISGGTTISEGQLNKEIPSGLVLGDFKDWYWYLSGVFVPYDFNTPIDRDDIVLYPVWNKSSYTVTYMANGADGTVPIDNNNYYKNAKASVLAPVGLTAPVSPTPPANLVFIGWKDATGKIYYPNDKLVIIGNMILTAQWGNIVLDTKLTYNANGGVGADIVVPLRNNDEHTVEANTFTLAGHEFIGWNTKADGTGEDFLPEDKIIVANPVPNILYAMWKVKTHTVRYVSNGNGTISGTTPQTVPHHGNTTEVTAIPATGYYFVGWNDGNSNPKRHEEGVTADATYTATFAKKIALTITANSDTKIYNGALQTVTGYTSSGLLSGHALSVISASGSGTNVGSYPVTFTGSPVIKNGTVDVTGNYNVTLVPGNLKITKAQLALSVTANSDTKVYTGLEQTVSGYGTPVGLLGGHTLSGITANGSGTNVGNYDVIFSGTPVIKDGTTDVTQNYNVTLIKGKLKITKAQLAVSVTANSDTKAYTGLEQTVGGYQAPVGLFGNHTLNGITASGSGTNVGVYPVTFSGTPVIMDGAVNVTENYNVALVPGKLVITAGELALEVRANSGIRVYNGVIQTITGYVESGLLSGHELSGITASGSGINVGTYPVEFTGTPVIKDANGVDVTINYGITQIPGNLEITKAEIALNVTANSDTRVYTGSEQIVSGYETSVGLLAGHALTGVVANGFGTDVGNYPVTFTGNPVIKDGNDVDVTANYNVTLVDGNLEIIAAQIAVSITANSDTKVYTGSEQTLTGYQLPVGLLAGHTLSGITASGSGTNVGSYPVTFTGTPVIMDGLVDVTQNYKVMLVTGSLEITPAQIAVNVTANSDTKVYTGLEQTLSGYQLPVGLLAGHTLSGLIASGSGTNVGSYPVTFTGTPVIMDGLVDVTQNYNVILVPGNLAITAGEIALEVRANSGTRVYDGVVQTITGYTESGLLLGHVLSGVEASGFGTNVGNYPVEFTGIPVIKDANGIDVTENYGVIQIPGNLEITPAEIPLTVTAKSGRMLYTGLEHILEDDGIPLGLLAGHTLSGIIARGSGTDIGDYPVTFTGIPVIRDADDVDVTENYKVAYVPGNLFIWKSEITVEKSADKETFLEVGEKIIYSYKVTNTGNVTISGPFTLADDKIDEVDMSTAPTTLAPGAEFTAIGEYVITQADLDAGFVTNVVKVTGIYEDEVTGEDELTVPADPEAQKPGLSVNKSADKAEFTAVGEVITYTYIVTNTGNVTLNGPFTLMDDKIGSIDTNSGTSLAPGERFEGTGVYVVTQADMNAGFVTNVVIATGTFGEGGVSGEDEVTVLANPPTPTPPTPTPPTPTPPTPPTPTPPTEELVEIDEEEIPLGNVDLEETEDETIIIEDDLIPQGIVPEEVTIEESPVPRGIKLPKTGTMPAGVFYGFGTLLVTAGFVFKKKKRRK